MKKSGQIFLVFAALLLSVSWVSAQSKPYTFEPAVETTPSPSPIATPSPEVVERIVYVPVPVQQNTPEQTRTAPAATPVSATSNIQLISSDPRVREAVSNALAVESHKPGKESLMMAAMSTSGGYGFPNGSFGTPPVVLQLNKLSFQEGDILQTSLRVVGNDIRRRVYVSWFLVDLETFRSKVGFVGTRVLVPGETISIQNYTWDGNEPSGLYAYGVFLIDSQTGSMLALPVTNFVFRNFQQWDSNGYLRVDSAEYVPADRYKGAPMIRLKGNFFPSGISQFHQYAEIAGVWYTIQRSTNNEAWIDLRYAPAPPPGVYDIHFVAWHELNTVYDSFSAPSVLKIFNQNGGKG